MSKSATASVTVSSSFTWNERSTAPGIFRCEMKEAGSRGLAPADRISSTIRGTQRTKENRHLGSIIWKVSFVQKIMILRATLFWRQYCKPEAELFLSGDFKTFLHSKVFQIKGRKINCEILSASKFYTMWVGGKNVFCTTFLYIV